MKQLSDSVFEEEKLVERQASWLASWLPAGILVGLLTALYWQIAHEMFWDWWDDANYSHGFLVPFFSGYLIWQRRSELAAIAPQTSWVGLPVLLAGLGELIVGDFAAEY